MTQRLKSWESPRRQGRNDKGKGGSARQRQIKKQMKMLRKKLKGEKIEKQNLASSSQKQKQKIAKLKTIKLNNKCRGREQITFLLFYPHHIQKYLINNKFAQKDQLKMFSN